jgi:hypothetical protein
MIGHPKAVETLAEQYMATTEGKLKEKIIQGLRETRLAQAIEALKRIRESEQDEDLQQLIDICLEDMQE